MFNAGLSFSLEMHVVYVDADHSPEFYSEVAGKLEKIARRSTKIKTPIPRVKSSPGNHSLVRSIHLVERFVMHTW